MGKLLVEEFIQTLYWQWRCAACAHVVRIGPGEVNNSPHVCQNCSALHSMRRDKRYDVQHALRLVTDLWAFFDWMKFKRIVTFNPVPRPTGKDKRIIRHYSFEVIQKLCAYIRQPNADPVEALILYLVVFWACSYWELRHAEIHKLLADDSAGLSSLSEAYYVILARPMMSIRRQGPGRTDDVLEFSGLATPWLKPLLDRFERHRQHVLKNPENQYLIIAPGRSRHNAPVCDEFIRRIITRATHRALGGNACTLNGLRQTIAVMYADNAGSTILKDFGWSGTQTICYSNAPRETILSHRPSKKIVGL